MTSAELRGLCALVTGASKGIGYAVANQLHLEGATVLATARTAPSLAEGIHFVAADLVSVEGCGAVAAAVRDRLGGIDIVRARRGRIVSAGRRLRRA
jgi:NAD(P)-dependent dehydrogenase (short-subunit alcohol dehydrogenase family)